MHFQVLFDGFMLWLVLIFCFIFVKVFTRIATFLKNFIHVRHKILEY
jgi:hypothetical protein